VDRRRAKRLLFQGVQRLYSADWDRPWGEEAPRSVMVFIGIQLPEEDIRAAFAGLKKIAQLPHEGPIALQAPSRRLS